MTDMVVGFPFAPKQYRANYVCLEMRGGSFFLHYYLWTPRTESNFIDTMSERRGREDGMEQERENEKKWQMTDKFI